jgi:hypothetical protein
VEWASLGLSERGSDEPARLGRESYDAG